jgi:hypothetical protein
MAGGGAHNAHEAFGWKMSPATLLVEKRKFMKKCPLFDKGT